VIDRGTLDRIVDALHRTEIWTGWLAMLIFLPLAITSNNAAQRWLHTGMEDAATGSLSGGGSGADPLGGPAQLGQLAAGVGAFRPASGAVGLPAVVLVPAATPGSRSVNGWA
jgi:hypothetical protein